MKTKHLRLMQRVYIILFFCFMYLPIAYMIVFSFNQSKGYALFTGFTLKWYTSLFHNASILRALAVSVEVALISAVIATILGTAASLGIASMGRKSRLVVTNITYIPVVNPEIITGISLMLLFVAYQRFAQYHHGPAHAAHRAHRVQRAVCHLQRHAQAQAAGRQTV